MAPSLHLGVMCSSGFSFCGWFVWVQRMFPIQPIGRLSVAVVAQDVGNDMAVDIATLMGIDGATVASGNCLLYKGCFGLGGFKICIFRGWIFSTMVGSHLLGLEVGPSYLSSVLVGNHGPAKNDSDNRVSSTSGSKTTPISQKNVAASIPLLEYVSPKSWRV